MNQSLTFLAFMFFTAYVCVHVVCDYSKSKNKINSFDGQRYCSWARANNGGDSDNDGVAQHACCTYGWVGQKPVNANPGLK